jgi:predicted transcriptional regulator
MMRLKDTNVRREPFILLTVILLICPIMISSFSGNQVEAQKPSRVLTTTEEGASTLWWSWGDPNMVGKPATFGLNISKYWDIKNASIGISSSSLIQNGHTIYPLTPRMDVGSFGDYWVWPDTFGQVAQFSGGVSSEDLAFKINETKTIAVPLPVGAKIENITLDVNNTGTGRYEYTMTVKNGIRPVWYMSSLDFVKGQFIPTNDNSSKPVKINSVCVDQLNIVIDDHLDIVAAGNGGNLFTIMYDGASPTGFSVGTQPLVLGQGAPSADLLDCSIDDYNKDGAKDIAASTADGKIYVLTNTGVGQLIPAHTINIAANRMDSVAMGDVNNDTWGDVVGGYLNGRIYVSTYDASKNSFKAPVMMNYAGNGSMNGLAMKDMDLDGLNDVVGADEDRHWYLVKNNGTGLNQTIQVSCGGNDLTSIAIADFNNDAWPDVISGSIDGQFYMSYNNAGGFDRGTMIRGGGGSMKDVVAADFDKNGYAEVLGLNGDGWIYVVNNELGKLQDAKKLIEVGQDQNTIAVGDLNNDGAPDLVTGGNKGITIFWNTFGQKHETLGIDDGGVLKSEIQRYIDNYKPVPKDLDKYGNTIVNVPLLVFSTYGGQLRFDHLNVTYSYERKVDIKAALNVYVRDYPEMADHEGYVSVPFQIVTNSTGAIYVENISVQYDINLAAIIDRPAGQEKFNESDMVILKGHSNLDRDCTATDLSYSWTIDTKPLGTGCSLSTRVLQGIGGPGLHHLRFSVERPLTHEMTYSEIDIEVLEPSPPVVILPPNAKVVPGKEVRIQINATDSDLADVQNLTYALVIAPQGMTINSKGMIYWKPTSKDVGKHYVVFNVSDNKNVTQGSFYVKVERQGSPVAVPVCLNWPVIVTVIIISCAFGFVMAGTEIGIFAFYSFVFLMYTRLKQEMVLDNFVRGQIYGHICENPGLHLSEIKKRLVVPNGTLVYHLRTLEREGLIKSYQNGAGRVFYSSKVKVSKELIHLTKAQRWILQIIKQKPGISQKELSKETGLSDSTVNRIVHELREQGMVRMNKAKSTSCFIIEDTCIF